MTSNNSLAQHYAVCIVGAGAVGLSLAAKFIGAEASVLLIEGGEANREDKSKDNYDVINLSSPEVGLDGSRDQGLGGSTQIWGGQALPFSSVDFKSRDWVNCPGWPIEESSISPYYEQVEDLFAVRGVPFDTDIWGDKSFSEHEVVARFARDDLHLNFSKISPEPNFYTRFGESIEQASNISLVTNTVVLSLVEDETRPRIQHLVLDNDGHQSKVSADFIILCCGGIENPRLLLASKSKSDQGVGNQFDQVGRFFQDHIGLYVAQLLPINFARFAALFASQLQHRVKLVPKVSLSNDAQIKHQVLNITGNLESQSNAQDPINLMRAVFRSARQKRFNRSFWKSVVVLLKHPIELANAVYEYLVLKRVYLPRNVNYFLTANIESVLDEESRITLSDAVDCNGMPKAEISWKLHDDSRRSALLYSQRLQKVLQKMQIAEVKIKPALESAHSNWRSSCYSLYHHMGGTRMSEQPQHGVVDTQLKVHGLSNLYVAGTSVLPTGGASNPTFTALALALRLADHIKQKLGKQSHTDQSS